MTLNYSGDPRAAAAEAADLERAGIDVGWVAELYSFDAVSILGYLAAKTETMELGSSILPIYSRTPTLTAMTAAGLDAVSEGRFILGIGASGPQVIEGWHGVPYDRPIGRQRELIDICRKVWRREVVTHDGPSYHLPLPADQGTGLGKPLKLINHPKRADIPVYIASLGPKNVEVTAEIANGWIPVFFHPDKADSVWGDPIAAGLAKRDASLPPAEAEQIQDLYLAGRKDEAMAAVPQEFLDATAMVGDEGRVRERIEAYRAAGVTRLQVQPMGDNQLQLIEKVKGWIS